MERLIITFQMMTERRKLLIKNVNILSNEFNESSSLDEKSRLAELKAEFVQLIEQDVKMSEEIREFSGDLEGVHPIIDENLLQRWDLATRNLVETMDLMKAAIQGMEKR
jgi:uncharacterized coiled-coil DUF342 family protein